MNSDIEVLKAIRLVHPDCSFILDANEGYIANQAIEVLDRLNGLFYLDVEEAARKAEAAQKRAADIVSGAVQMDGCVLFQHEPRVFNNN